MHALDKRTERIATVARPCVVYMVWVCANYRATVLLYDNSQYSTVPA